MALSEEEKQKIQEEERYRAEARAKLASDAKPGPNSSSGCGGCLIAGLLAIVGVIALGSLGVLMDTNKTPEQKAHETKQREEQACNSDKIGAFVMAQKFVEKVLKAPSTAIFPRGTKDSTIENIGICTYKVRSFVDAENSFGAKIRSHYTALIKYEGQGTWSAVDVQIDQ